MASKLPEVGIALGLLVVIGLLVNSASAIDCSDGYFGDDCTGVCRCNSTEDICDKRTGHCHSGCADGWQGAICQNKVPTETGFEVSVMGVAVGISVSLLIVTVAAIFCCISRLQRIRTRNQLSRDEQRGQRQGRLQEFFHNYNSPRRSERRNPFRVIPFSQKLESRYHPKQQQPQPWRPPRYATAIATSTNILPPRSETPPPTYQESIATDTQRHEIAARRQSRETLISGHTNNSSREIWTIT